MASHDLVLRGGRVIDGSGAAGLSADVAIDGERIAAVGRLPRGSGRRELDAEGFVVAPGFIDVHTHDDRALFVTSDMSAKVSQGVTTVRDRQLRHLARAADPRSRAAAAARSD